MASVAAQRTGLITATVVASIIALTALVFAFIFSARASKAELTLEDMGKKYNDVVRSNALSGPVATAIRGERTAEGSRFTQSDTLLDVAVGQRDDLAKLVGGTTPAVAMQSAKDAIAQANEAMKAAGQTAVSENLAGALRELAGALNSLNQQKNAAVAQANSSKEEAAKTIAAAQGQIEAAQKQIAEARAQSAAETAGAQTDRTAQQGVLTAANQAFEAANKALADEMGKISQQLSDAQRDKAAMQKEVNTLRGKLGNFRPEAEQSLIRKADGAITRISTDKTVYIDLGAGQQVVPGMTFEVYNKLEGVPALRADETSLPAGKASIEVVRVGSNGSECRVIASKPNQTITEGDVVANLVYDRNTKYNFVVYGKFDLTKKGSPTAEDSAVIKRLVTEFGGQSKDRVGVDTDFLVIGAEPTIPDFSEEQRRDPVNAKILADAQAELDAYNAVVNRARELFIPVLNQNRFLYYVGYFDKARR